MAGEEHVGPADFVKDYYDRVQPLPAGQLLSIKTLFSAINGWDIA